METQASIPAAAPLHAPATWPTALRSGMDWGAILAGGVLAVGAGLVFKVFGAALGLTGISAEPGETGPFDLWIIVTAVWMALSMVLTHLAGGYVAGRMRRRDPDLSAEDAGVRDGVRRPERTKPKPAKPPTWRARIQFLRYFWLRRRL